MGVFDNTFISTTEPTTPAPIGGADATATFCCASLNTGGLGPLPRIVARGLPPSFPGGTTSGTLVGFAINPGLGLGNTEAIIMMEFDNGSDHYFEAYSLVVESNSIHNIVNNSGTTIGSEIGGCAYPEWTRVSTQPVEGVSGYELPTPTLAFPNFLPTDSNAAKGHVYLYPDPTARTSFQCYDMVSSSGTGISGQLVCYGNRILIFQAEADSWPVSGGVVTNEDIGYTDPPQGNVYPDQFGTDIPNETILSAEDPWGYGAWGSISVGELILIKKFGGGVVMNGDIAAPTSVIPLPGILSTGDIIGRASATSIGLVYCSQNKGAWVWNGGNISQKISPQLADNFFDAQSTGSVVNTSDYGFYVARWQDWLVFSNNYVFMPDTGGWWVLHPNDDQGNAHVTGQTFFWWSEGRLGQQFYAAPLNLTSSSTYWYQIFDNTSPAAHWQWQSLPIHVVPTADHVLDVRQVTLRLSVPDSTSATTATVTIGSWSDTTTAPIGPDPEIFRFNAGQGALGLQDIVINITGDTPTAGNWSPILHSIDVEFTVRAYQASAN